MSYRAIFKLLLTTALVASFCVVAGTAPAHAATTTAYVRVVLPVFQNRPDVPTTYTVDEARNLFMNGPASVRAFLEQQSNGSMTMSAAIDRVTIPRSYTSPLGYTYDLSPDQSCQLVGDGQISDFVNGLSTYIDAIYGEQPPGSHVLTILPSSRCPQQQWVGDTWTTYERSASRYPWTIAVYSVGMRASEALRCDNHTVVGPDCAKSTQWRDLFDSEGFGACSLNAELRNLAGWGTPITDTTNVGAPRSYSLRASDLRSDGTPQALRWSTTASQFGTGIEFEWHTNTFGDCAANEPQGQGMIVRTTRGLDHAPYLLDTHPGTNTFNDARMQIGELFSDPSSTMRARLDTPSPPTGLAQMTVGAYGAVSLSGNDVSFVARPGDANDILVEASANGTWKITERSGAPIQASSLGCSTLTSNTITCHAPAGGGRATIDTDDGNDTVQVRGNTGVATVRGGTGNDTFVADAAASPVDYSGGVGSDKIDFSARTLALNVNVDNVANDGAAGENSNVRTDIESVIGGSGADKINGSKFNDTLIGGPGDDTLVGGLGDDSLDGGLGNDIMSGRDGFDTVNYGSRTTPVVASLDGLANDGETSRHEVDQIQSVEALLGGTANDTLTGSDANDLILGADGNNKIDGRGGDDIILGGAGNETIKGGSGNDTIYAGAGIDSVSGDTGNDTLDTRDKIADRPVSCGGGTADRVYYDGTLDKPKGCETLIAS